MAGILVTLLLMPVVNHAQEQAKTPSDQSISHVRIDLLLTEYDGQKKLSSLPYTIYAESSPQQHRAQAGRLRMGVRVPVPTDSSGNNFQYMNVGTDIDCNAWTLGEGAYDVAISVNRSSLYAPSQTETGGEQIHAVGGRMIIRNFSTDFDLKLHDGETTDGTSATDPLNGHVLKISVTLHVIK
ncbi:MAG TPA: hypothetical protein VKS00_00615 [Candidatus Acidoferrales bacterium]|nr:hypothetical protein [Candidatus Acidoferrales bacterium]